MKILVIRQDHLGDLILTTPLFRSLRKAGHDVHVVARRSSLPVLEGNPHISLFHALEDIAPAFPRGWLSLARWIFKQSVDVVLLPHAKPVQLSLAARLGLFGRIVAMWGGIPARVMGLECLRSGLPARTRHMSDIWLDLARHIGVEPCGLKPEIFLSEPELREVDVKLPFPCGAEWIVIHPGCAGNTCNLPPQVYAETARILAETSELHVVLTGSETERRRFGGVFDDLRSDRVWNAMGFLSLRELCALIARAECLVSVGTGPLHIASAVGARTVSPFCRKPGVCATVWGSLGGRASVLEPSPDHCAFNTTAQHCDFAGSIAAQSIVAMVLQE